MLNRAMFKIPISLALSVIMLLAVVPMVVGEIDVNPHYKDDKTALHLAFDADGDPVQEMQKLLELGADINARRKHGRTPLHYAVERNNLDAVQFLLEKGAQVNLPDDYGATPIIFAVIANNQEIENLLEAYGASRAGLSSFQLKQEQYEYCMNPSIRYDPMFSLHFAASAGNVSWVQCFLDLGIDPNTRSYKGITPLSEAVISDERDVVILLLSRGADVNARNADYGATSLHYAGFSGSFYAAQALLESGADVAIQDNYGRTPLYSAIKGESRMLVRLLLEHGADINAVTKHNLTPLEYALKLDKPDMAEFLLELGARY